MANKNQATQTTNRTKNQFLSTTNLPKDDMKEVHIFKALPVLSSKSDTSTNTIQKHKKRKAISVLIVNQNPKASEQ